MIKFDSMEVLEAVEAEMPWAERAIPPTVYAMLSETVARYPDRNATSFQLLSDPRSKAETLTWRALHERVTSAANLFRRLGVGENDVVALLMPNCHEMTVALLGAMTAGIVNPINPLLDSEQIAGILNETGAKVLVTLRAFPRSDVAEKAVRAVALAPTVKDVLEVDLLHYMAPPKSLVVPFIRPRAKTRYQVPTQSFSRALKAQRSTALDFTEPTHDRVAAYYHTGGTTGLPKIAQHKHSGMVYNGWLGGSLLFGPDDVLMCPLPLFHVFAAYPVLMSALRSGAHVIFPTPAGYRGEGVFDNFWKLIERWQATFLITVPTALAALMQRPVNADVSSLKTAISGSAPLPVELYRRFEAATGVEIAEGYGLTECTCLVSVNPIHGKKKVGSVGFPLPYCDVRILRCTDQGDVLHECATDEVGEICVANPGVFEGSTYMESGKNLGLYADRNYLRTGDLGRIDPEGYLWITGRKKDLIIRGGHNIDPAEIEQALAGHEAVAFVGAIGQPDAHSGELPCAYVELVKGANATPDLLLAFCRDHIHERAAIPKYIEIIDELPKTAVGKVFKPELRKRAIRRIYDQAVGAQGVTVVDVVEDRRLGLVAILARPDGADETEITRVLGGFTVPWRWADPVT